MNLLVTADTERPYPRRFGDLDVRVVGIADVAGASPAIAAGSR